MKPGHCVGFFYSCVLCWPARWNPCPDWVGRLQTLHLTRFGGFFYFWSRVLPVDESDHMSEREEHGVKAQVPTSWGDERRGWHIDKTINAGDLISIAAFVIPVLIWAATVETRFTATAAQTTSLERQVSAEKVVRDLQRAEDRQTTQAALIDLQQQIRTMDARVSDKLDRISDKVGARR